MDSFSLETLGWSIYQSSEEIDTSTIARVTAVHRSHLRAATKNNEINVHLSGYVENIPVVGDWVEVTPQFEDEQGEPGAVLRSVLPRNSILTRWSDRGEQPMAANIERVFIVTSANQDFKMNRLHRFLLLVKKGRAEPVIILSKIDLMEEWKSMAESIESSLSTKCIGTSSLESFGIDQVKGLMPVGSTSVFVGSSGVGKSSLVNALIGQDIQKTAEIREDDDKGRHATRTRQMFLVPECGLIIDTPGIREVQVFGQDEDVLKTFPIIEKLVGCCKFSNCQHGSEPGCAIQEALESGELEVKQWESFVKLQKEIEYSQRKADKSEMANSKKRFKEISKFARANKKIRGRG